MAKKQPGQFPPSIKKVEGVWEVRANIPDDETADKVRALMADAPKWKLLSLENKVELIRIVLLTMQDT